ncbi:MAG: hypothetical protein QXU97_04370 [Fervidicoccaceae archaeon]
MIGEALAAVGAVLVLLALVVRRLSVAVVSLFFGSALAGLSIAMLVSPAAGVVVATLYAGLLVTLILIALAVVPTSPEEMEPRIDYGHFLALVFGLSSTYLISVLVLEHAGLLGLSEPRAMAIQDVGALALLMLTTAIGVVMSMWGVEE